MDKNSIFEIQGVSKDYKTRGGEKFRAVDDVTLDLERGVAYALVGESGSGKTTLGRLLAGMIAPSNGEIFFEGRRLQDWRRKDRMKFCRKVQVIFQNPYLSLDPNWNVRDILEEGVQEMPGRVRKQKIAAILERVRMPMEFLHKKPYALSGGERQRVAIARALLMEPECLILDEPTSQLDVSTQAEVMKLLKELKPALNGGLLFITHDIALASQLAEVFIVMKQGQVVEKGFKREILVSAREPYTQQLLSALPAWPPVF